MHVTITAYQWCLSPCMLIFHTLEDWCEAFPLSPLTCQAPYLFLAGSVTQEALQVWFSGRRRKDKLAMEKLQARAGSMPHGGTPGSSPAPPSPQSQQPSARLPAGTSSPFPSPAED